MIINPYVFASAATDPNWASVSLLLHCDGTDASTTFTDNSNNVFTVTANGNAQLDTAELKFGTAAGLFDGTGDYLSVANNAAFDFNTQPFTMECWVRLTLDGSAATFYGLFGKRTGTGVFSPFNCYISGDGKIGMLNSLNGSSWGVNIASSASAIASATWTHCAFTRDGSNNWAVYYGTSGTGTRGATASVSGGVMSNTTSLTIGVSTTAADFPCNGHIDDIRITKGVGRYTGATYTVPTAAFPNS